jgi:hypothetical protein
MRMMPTLILFAAFAVVPTGFAEDRPTAEAPAAAPGSPASEGFRSGDPADLGDVRSGLRVHIDPKTGAFVPPPGDQAGPSGSRSTGPAVVEPSPEPAPPQLVESPAPGGGVMVQLEGRFLSHMTASAAAKPQDPAEVDCTTSGDAPATSVPEP